MSSKIFKAIWIVVISMFVATLIFIVGISYNYFSSIMQKQLKNETELAAQGVEKLGREYFEDLNVENYRITWIDNEGKVLYDNEADSANMENHLEREEVKEALESGYGESSRYSNTLAEKQFYAAIRLSDNSILRLSVIQVATWTLVFGFAQPICIVIFIALVLSFVLASRLAKKIVKPINEIDISHPEKYFGEESYREVEPLLRHIATQNMQLKEDRKQIEKTSLIRQEFTANASHELKTPLHAISGYAELLDNDMVKEEDIKPFVRKIRDESLRMSKLVEDIIDLSKLDSGIGEMKWEKCDLYRIAQNAVDSLEAAASDKDITVSIEGSEAVIKAIPQLMYSIVYNLCDNAIKYNNPGGEVKVSITQERDNTVLKVRDNGIGISEENQDRIFERFYRVDKSHSKEVGGTGLGLSIVKHAVMIHQGKLEVNSKPGEGAEFVVILPNAPEEDLPDFNEEDSSH